MKLILSLIFLCLPAFSIASSDSDPKGGVVTPVELPPLVLKGKDGGHLDGKTWDSSTLKGKVHVLFYVDPDKKDLNEAASEALSKAKFPDEKLSTVAIINMAATWLPNFAIASSLKAKQKKYPKAVYLKDFKKVLVKKWSLKDNSSNILLFNKLGKVIFKVMGKLSSDQIKLMLKTIKANI